ncbi:hypothetical protein Q7P35_008666 [Cladosporium inversicolor]
MAGDSSAKRPLEASSTSGGRASKRPSYGHETIITVLVGPDEHRFAVHKDVICATSKFFRAACSTRWLKIGERFIRLPDIQPSDFRVYVHWSYRGNLVVEEDATKADRGMNLARIYIVGDVLDDMKLRNSATRLLNAMIIAQGFLGPRVIRLIWANTTTSSSLRRWTVETAILAVNRRDFEKNAARYPADFMSAMALEALQLIRPIARDERERDFTPAMNIQPPVHDRFIVTPGATQRDAVPTARKPSLVPGGPPNPVRSHAVAAIGEFLGTFLFLFFAFAGAQVANEAEALTNSDAPTPSIGALLYISLSFGFSLAVCAWVFFRISGGLFNPAVTLALTLIGCLTYTRAAVVIIAQLVGAITSAGIVKVLFPQKFTVATTLAEGTNLAQGLFIEMFLTALLVFTILMLTAEKHRATFIAPIGIGLALFIGHLAGVRFTGAGINPARAFAPAVVTGSFPSYHWIYWIGPILGAGVAVVAYRVIKALEYEAYGAVGQDADHPAVAIPLTPADPPAVPVAPVVPKETV